MTRYYPESRDDQQRWQMQALRLRMLRGQHGPDVEAEIDSTFASEIAATMSVAPDLSRNPFLLTYSQLATAYLQPPRLMVEGVDEEQLATIATRALWSSANDMLLQLLALNNAVIRCDVKHWLGAETVEYRIVDPSTIVTRELAGRPNELGAVEEYRMRDGRPTWDVWDITGDAPVFRIDGYVDGERVDHTHIYMPNLNGGYPYIDRQGQPILPYTLYSKRPPQGRLWDYTSGIEVVSGTLRLAALYSHYTDGFVSASHPQRYVIDLDTQAATAKNVGGAQVDVIAVDRKSILRLKSTGQGGGSVGQWSAGLDVVSSLSALQTFEQGLAVYAGLNPSDLKVTGAQSGYAIEVSREGQRHQQRLVTPQLAVGDAQLLSTAARLANMFLGTSLPEEAVAYRIEYTSLDRSLSEAREGIW